jgi:hypothetical protein
VEAALAALTGVLGIVTLFWKDWIEVTGWDPDNGSGSVEVGIVVGLLVVSAIFALLARIEWRRLAASSPTS